MKKKLIGKYIDTTKPLNKELCYSDSYKAYEKSIKEATKRVRKVTLNDLFDELESGNNMIRERAMNELVIRSQKVIAKCASKYANPYNFMDLVIEGNIFIKEAIKTYRKSNGNYISYVSRCLTNNYINNIAQDNDLVVSKEKSYSPVLQNINNHFNQVNHRYMTKDEMDNEIEKLQNSGKPITWYTTRYNNYSDLEDSAVGKSSDGTNEDSLKVIDVVSYNLSTKDDTSVSVVKDIQDNVNEYLKNARMSNKNKIYDSLELLYKYYGVGDYHEHTTSALCEEYNISIREFKKRIKNSIDFIKKVQEL